MKEKEQAYEGQRTKVWQNRDREQDWNRTRREPVTGQSGHRDWNGTGQCRQRDRIWNRTGVRTREGQEEEQVYGTELVMCQVHRPMIRPVCEEGWAYI